MTTLHTFGCSITQGHALPDVVRPPLTDSELRELGRPAHWSDEHILAPSQYAWPKVLADRLGIPVENYARRGACFQQIARQCAVACDNIQQGDIVIVMWTYLSRISLQWPARTSVPLTHLVDTGFWRTRILPGFNKLFGLSRLDSSTDQNEENIYTYIHNSAQYTYNPLGIYDRYYNNLVLQTMCDGFLRARGAKVIHLSVEPEPYLQQLEEARLELDPSLQSPWVIPEPDSWYTISVDHHSCRIIHDPRIPTAGADHHPSEPHHRNFADHIYLQYFCA
jgi:hypothetical protein